MPPNTISFTATELLRNKFEEEEEKGPRMQADDTLPPLYLEPLRNMTDANCCRHVALTRADYDASEFD